MSDTSELHNRLAADLVAALVKPVIAAGGGPRDVLVLLESVALGVCLVIGETAEITGKPEDVVDTLAAGVKQRWADDRGARKRMAN